MAFLFCISEALQLGHPSQNGSTVAPREGSWKVLPSSFALKIVHGPIIGPIKVYSLEGVRSIGDNGKTRHSECP